MKQHHIMRMVALDIDVLVEDGITFLLLRLIANGLQHIVVGFQIVGHTA